MIVRAGTPSRTFISTKSSAWNSWLRVYTLTPGEVSTESARKTGGWSRSRLPLTLTVLPARVAASKPGRTMSKPEAVERYM
ncbi:MAG: hypothetical protein M0C28_15580 [Candidatus Moduliflexus flocculans]|nr:hypothetical protein [Candidatus Moduliflexus flocculans]